LTGLSRPHEPAANLDHSQVNAAQPKSRPFANFATTPATATQAKLDEIHVARHGSALFFARLYTSLLPIHRDASFPHS
jgi:hypothetical protein